MIDSQLQQVALHVNHNNAQVCIVYFQVIVNEVLVIKFKPNTNDKL
jgi:hypothetical protein